MLKKIEKEIRKERSDKRSRVNLSLDQDTYNKLCELATACQMKHTPMASELVRMAVNHLDIIEFYQNKYCKNDKYRVLPIMINGKVEYR